MSRWPFRFVHAADFHLEQPPFGLVEIPDHLRELFLESVYWSAERVFETVLAEEAEFLVLSGDVLDPVRTGPRGPLFLIEQFERLAERETAVYWAGGRVDPPEAWPSAIRLPENVHVFPGGRPEEHVHLKDANPLARLIGISRGRSRTIRAADFDPDPNGLFSIAVAHGAAKADSLQGQGIDYWALGGNHARHTLFSSPRVAHYPGGPQGRQPEACGPHGCTLVQVDDQRHARITMVPTDVMRWQCERIVVQDSTSREDLDSQLHQRMHALVEASPGMDLIVTWTVAGSGHLLSRLRHGPLVGELLESLRAEYGYGPPAAWSASIAAEPTAVLPPEWYEQETIRGDFLRAIRHYQMNPGEPLDLESYLSESHLAGTVGSLIALSDATTRQSILGEAAMLGVELLTGEVTES